MRPDIRSLAACAVALLLRDGAAFVAISRQPPAGCRVAALSRVPAAPAMAVVESPAATSPLDRVRSAAVASFLSAAVIFTPALTVLPEHAVAQPAATRQNAPTAAGSRVNKDADSLLRYGLPINNAAVRKLQSQVETGISDIKVKRIGAAIGDLQQARGTIKGQGKDMLKSVRPSEIDAATQLLAAIDEVLDPGIAALSENVAQGSVQERSALDRASSAVADAASKVPPAANGHYGFSHHNASLHLTFLHTYLLSRFPLLKS